MLQNLTDKQLVRLYHKLVNRICDSWGVSCFDMPTLHVCKPASYAALTSIKQEGARRKMKDWPQQGYRQ